MPQENHCETYRLIALAQNGDSQALEQLTQSNMGLVYSVARKLSGRGADSEDLIQLGAIGLLKAIRKFDPSYEVKFSTYAVPMILGEMRRFLRDDGPIKVSRSLKLLASKAYAAKEKLAYERNREPSISEIAEELGESCEDLAVAMEAVAAPESIYTPCGENETLLLIDKLSGGNNSEAATVNRLALLELIQKLPNREKKLILLRYFKDNTQSRTAAQLGISQVQVSRIEKKILQAMKDNLSEG